MGVILRERSKPEERVCSIPKTQTGLQSVLESECCHRYTPRQVLRYRLIALSGMYIKPQTGWTSDHYAGSCDSRRGAAPWRARSSKPCRMNLSSFLLSAEGRVGDPGSATGLPGASFSEPALCLEEPTLPRLPAVARLSRLSRELRLSSSALCLLVTFCRTSRSLTVRPVFCCSHLCSSSER